MGVGVAVGLLNEVADAAADEVGVVEGGAVLVTVALAVRVDEG